MSILIKITRKLQDIYFRIKIKVYGLRNLPVQTKKERNVFKAIFGQASSGKGRLKIFEWGSGFSTLYYAKYLTGGNIDFEWHAIDNHRGWYETIKSLLMRNNLSDKVHLYLQEFPPFWEKPGWGPLPPPCGVFAPCLDNEKKYINLPLQLGGKFDVVIVDARFRRHCIQVAREVLKPTGIVILHDAQKKHYQTGLDAFPYGRFIDSGNLYPLQEVPNSVWVGSMQQHPVFETLKGF